MRKLFQAGHSGPMPVPQKSDFLSVIPYDSAYAYRKNSRAMLEEVNSELMRRKDLSALIGEAPVEMMLNNHDNHVNFMATVFLLPAPALLPKIIPWVYRAYAAHGFSYDYFPVELDAWIHAVQRHLGEKLAKPIVDVYQWMKQRHDYWIESANQVPAVGEDAHDKWKEKRNVFLNGLLNGNHSACVELVAREKPARIQTEQLCSNVLTPSMYEIGRFWESGTISVAEEHIASSIVSRCVTHLYTSTAIPKRSKKSPRAIVTASPGEFHQIGAMMLSDCLEREGWISSFCGANTPAQDLLKLCRSSRPDLVAISVTMPYNLVEAQQLIKKLRADPDTRDTAILVGGQAFLLDDKLADIVGADACGFKLEDSLRLAHDLLKKKS